MNTPNLKVWLNAAQWKKSTRSNGNGGNNCVECAFVRAEASSPDGPNCVEHAYDPDLHDMVLIRDSKQNHLPEDQRTVLEFTPAEWMAYLQTLRLGYGAIYAGDMFVIHRDTKMLTFNLGEWDAFMDGVIKGEFDVPVDMLVNV